MLNTSLKEKQKKILKSTKKIFNIKFEENYQDLYYLSTWSKNCGNYFLKKKFLVNDFFFDLIESFSLLYRKIRVENTSYNYIKNYSEKKTKKNLNLIISYYNEKNKEIDTQFSANRKNSKNSIWLIINLGKSIQSLNYPSIILNRNPMVNKWLALIFTAMYYPMWLFNKKKSIYENSFFKEIEQIVDELPLSDVKKVFLPYEAQPFQKLLINKLKKTKKQIKIFGYAHGGLPSLPIEYFNNKKISKFFVHSLTEKRILIDFLGWNKNSIKITKSFRFTKKNKIKKNFIYLPHSFTLNKKLIEDFKILFQKYNLKNFEVKNHPAMINSKKHIILKKIIYNFKNKKNNNGITIKNSSIFIGVTGAILEGLQNELNIIHLMNYPEFELYSNYLWKSFFVKKISERIYLYKLKKGNTLIQYSKTNFFLNKFKL